LLCATFSGVCIPLCTWSFLLSPQNVSASPISCSPPSKSHVTPAAITTAAPVALHHTTIANNIRCFMRTNTQGIFSGRPGSLSAADTH
jgi:hypothetical protein